MFLIACAAALACGSWGRAEPLSDATSRREVMFEAQQAIPFDRLNAETQMRVWSVVSDASIYRRLPVQRIECDPDLFVFLIRRPEVIVDIWKLMGITQVSAQRTGPYTMQASDGAGTHSTLDLMYGSRDMHLIYADGYYEGPLLKKRTPGKCVLLLRSRHDRSVDGRPMIDLTLDVFIKIESAGAELLARTLYPLVGSSADINFSETAKFVSKLSQAAEANSAGVQRMALRLENIDASTRQQFMQLTAMVSQRAEARLAGPQRIEIEQVGEMPRPLSSAGAAAISEDEPLFLDAAAAPRRELRLRR